ncbi:hypothetical protein [Empedobacter brevis]|uniref:hypothetical protein n=1 Tax=Empedobacter brevis TaxID=247 RepID=UPI00289F152F|nr:hypothetical protein [Empedobacter brevis]
MFNIDNKLLYIEGLYDVTSNYTSLVNDGDNDIIYIGTNRFGTTILGSIVFENDEDFFVRYIHTLVSSEDLHSFLNQKVTLRDLINKNDTIFILDKRYNGEIISKALISINDFPKSLLPLENSYCPKFVRAKSLDYSFSLQGKLADLHKADPLTISETNTKIFNLLNSATTFLDELGINHKIFSEVSLAGSYELNYSIELKEELNLFSIPNNDVNNFIADFLSYIFNTLPNENDNVIKTDTLESEKLIEVKNELKLIYEKRNIYINDESTENRLIDLINYSVNSLQSFEYKGFDNIEIKNKIDNHTKIPIALINETYYNDVINKVYDIEIEKKDDIIILDEVPKKYTIQMYSFNKESGKGYSYYNTDDTINKVGIHLKGKNDYHNTIFTKSLDENIKIEVEGIGKWVNSILKLITIDL